MISVNWIQALKLRKMLKSAFWTVFVTKNVLTRPQRMRDGAPPHGRLPSSVGRMTFLNSLASAPNLYPVLDVEEEGETKT